MKDKCNRCGQCCYYLLGGNFVKCKNLRLDAEGSTCMIYGHHLGTEIDVGIFCNSIRDSPFKFYKCPYNDDRKEKLLEINLLEKIEKEKKITQNLF